MSENTNGDAQHCYGAHRVCCSRGPSCLGHGHFGHGGWASDDARHAYSDCHHAAPCSCVGRVRMRCQHCSPRLLHPQGLCSWCACPCCASDNDGGPARHHHLGHLVYCLGGGGCCCACPCCARCSLETSYHDVGLSPSPGLAPSLLSACGLYQGSASPGLAPSPEREPAILESDHAPSLLSAYGLYQGSASPGLPPSPDREPAILESDHLPHGTALEGG